MKQTAFPMEKRLSFAIVLAVILAGGLGLRLRPYTMNIPKPLLPLGDVPTLEIVLRQLAAGGFTRVVITSPKWPPASDPRASTTRTSPGLSASIA